MKTKITDGLQVIAAILLTTSMVVVNAAPVQPTPKQVTVEKSVVAKSTPEVAPTTAPQPVEQPQPAQTVDNTVSTPEPATQPAVQPQPVYSGSHEDWLTAAGIDPSDWGYVNFIVSRESGWNPCAYNPGMSDCSASPTSACGLVQQYPCGKIPGDWTDPVAALVWQKNYVTSRYGGYAQAVAHWQAYQSY